MVETCDPYRSDHHIRTYDVVARHVFDTSLFDSAYLPLKHFSISENEILDKSKGDGFTKLITVAQIFWLVISVIMREARGLASSQLEILTLAFAAVAVLTYLAQWNKPKCINVPTRIYLEKFSDNPEKAKWTADRLTSVIACDSTLGDGGGTGHEFVIFITVAILFGSLHCLAWNSSFPSSIERTVWRVASIMTVSLPATSCSVKLVPDDNFDVVFQYIGSPLLFIVSSCETRHHHDRI